MLFPNNDKISIFIDKLLLAIIFTKQEKRYSKNYTKFFKNVRDDSNLYPIISEINKTLLSNVEQNSNNFSI